jgi:metallophosphoesterase (TIGR00282 family)
MKIRVLALGDVVGKPGRAAIRDHLAGLVRREEVHFTVVNGENASGTGNGIGIREARGLHTAGVDCITLGDHVWRQADLIPFLERGEGIVRPANLPSEAVGRGHLTFQDPGGFEIVVINLIGQVFMGPADCPFHAVDGILDRLGGRAQVKVVDFHTEATSELNAMARHLDGRVSAVVGTHTHVQTADEKVLPGGTAMITDLGMTGPHESILGRRIEPVLRKMRTSMHARFDVATADVRMHGVVIEIETRTGLALSIRRIAESIPVE